MNKKRTTPRRFFYGIAVLAILVAWVAGYTAYLRHYRYLHPRVTWAVPWVETHIAPVDGVLIWGEQPIFTKNAGSVSYPFGTGPVKVAKGAVVARVRSGAGTVDLQAPQSGYFVSACDGHEGKWRYGQLWPGSETLPRVDPLVLMQNGTGLQSRQAVGKIVAIPQEVRFIGYVDATPEFQKQIRSGAINVKMDPLDTSSTAEVRVSESYGHRVKLCVALPWFPPALALSRNYTLLVETGESRGVAVPESAVVMREGVQGVFVLRGSNTLFCPVQGQAIDDGRFLVREGVNLGEAVVIDGRKAREGRVQLW